MEKDTHVCFVTNMRGFFHTPLYLVSTNMCVFLRERATFNSFSVVDVKEQVPQQHKTIDFSTNSWSRNVLFLSDPGPTIVYPCHSLTDWLTDSLTTLLKIEWIDLNFADYVDYADIAEYAEYAEYAKYAKYAEYAVYAKYQNQT